MKCKLFTEDGIKPVMTRKGDGAFDIYMPEGGTLVPGMNAIDLKVGFEIPEGHIGLILPRSSTSKKGVLMPMPPIDSNYRGSVTAYAANIGGSAIDYGKGHRLFQLVVVKTSDAQELDLVDKLSETERGENKEGSSGE